MAIPKVFSTKKTKLSLIASEDFIILPMACQIAQVTDEKELCKLEEFTQEQLNLAHANSITVDSMLDSNKKALKLVFKFADGSRITFIITGNKK
jgi:hypothetical protein